MTCSSSGRVMQIENGAWAVLRGFGRCRRSVLVASVLIPLSVISSPPTLSEEGDSKEADPFFQQRGIDDRFNVIVDLIAARGETRAQIDSEAGLGASLALERLFNVPSRNRYVRLQAYYRFSRHHAINFRYLRVSGSGTQTLLDEEFELVGIPFELGAAIGASYDTKFGTMEYRYSFLNNGSAEVGLYAGLGAADIDLNIFGQIGLNPGPVFTAAESVTETIPLPVAGLYADITLRRRLFLAAEGLLFSAAYGKYSGNIGETRVTLRWYATQSFGVGVGFNRTRVNIGIEQDRGDIRVDYLFEGPSVFITFLVGGLR